MNKLFLFSILLLGVLFNFWIKKDEVNFRGVINSEKSFSKSACNAHIHGEAPESGKEIVKLKFVCRDGKEVANTMSPSAGIKTVEDLFFTHQKMFGYENLFECDHPWNKDLVVGQEITCIEK